jgi:hypothetical protein
MWGFPANYFPKLMEFYQTHAEFYHSMTNSKGTLSRFVVFFSFSAQVHVFPHIVPKIPTIPDF